MEEKIHRIRQPLDDALDFTVRVIQEDHMEADLPLRGLAVNSLGRAHGGAIVSTADALMANLSGPPSDDRGTQRAVTVALQVHFIRAARGASVRFEAQLLHSGRRLSFTECKVYDQSGKLVAQISGSYARLEGEGGS
ncbi:MAG: PaaI family thioesterase [Thermaerobacter sp.]|nr:PaaI family thioesterase [Thermaerobacter sp.]